jgi:hypothetical protein
LRYCQLAVASKYVFVDEWDVDAPQEAVFDAVADARTYPDWWRPVYKRVDGDDPPAVGAETLHYFKGRLPYTLEMRARMTSIDRPRTFEVDVDGDLRGYGKWTFNAGGRTHARPLGLAGVRRPAAPSLSDPRAQAAIRLEPQLGGQAGDGGPRTLRTAPRSPGPVAAGRKSLHFR